MNEGPKYANVDTEASNNVIHHLEDENGYVKLDKEQTRQNIIEQGSVIPLQKARNSIHANETENSEKSSGKLAAKK